MKKVLALMLAVLMLGTVAFAAQNINNVWYSDVTPGSSIKIARDGISSAGGVTISGKLENGADVMFLDSGSTKFNAANALLRSVNSSNYSITNIKYTKVGKGLVSGVVFNDKEDRVEIKLADDLTNTNARDFEVSFKLKGKVKFTIRDLSEVDSYNLMVAANKRLKDDTGKVIYSGNAADLGLTSSEVVAPTTSNAISKKVTLPDVSFTVVGTVGYGKVEVSLGDDGDEDFENLGDVTIYTKADYQTVRENPRNPNATNGTLNGRNTDANEPTNDYIDIDRDVIKFVTGDGGTAGNARRTAGAYTADAILTQEYKDAMTLEARVYSGDTLYFSIDNDPISSIVDRLADVNADIDFYLFNSDKAFTTFNSTATLYFNDADDADGWYVYEIVNNGLVPRGEYSEDDGCWILRTRTLGQYVVSDAELSLYEIEGGDASDPANANPDTGANDVVGIATALAAVALVSAAAVSLKK